MIELLLEAERQLAAGRLDEAARIYGQAAEADPRNSIAVVGLARVAVERGEEREALRLGRRALEIDPENVAGRRLVARIEEVMAARGEAPPAAPAKPAGATRAKASPPNTSPPNASPPAASPPAASPRRRRGILGRILRRG